MAPVVSLPIRELQNLPDCRKRWADVEDTGTPSPWTDYPLPEFKPVWPDTPTPSHAICNPEMQIKNPLLLTQTHPELSEMAENAELASFDLPLQALEAPYHTLAQVCPALPDLMLPCAGPGFVEAPYALSAQSGYGFEYGGTGYALATQWPNFALPQQWVLVSVPAQMDTHEEPHVSVQFEDPQSMELPPPAQVDALTEHQSQKELQHKSGQCQPCAWFWRQAGCQNGEACGYCHLCPQGELKSRKKTKIAALRMGALEPVKATSKSSGAWGLKLDSLIQDKA